MQYDNLLLSDRDTDGPNLYFRTHDRRYPNKEFLDFNAKWMKQTEPAYRAAWLRTRNRFTIDYLKTHEPFAPWVAEMNDFGPITREIRDKTLEDRRKCNNVLVRERQTARYNAYLQRNQKQQEYNLKIQQREKKKQERKEKFKNWFRRLFGREGKKYEHLNASDATNI